MSKTAFEEIIVRQCSPTLAGIKTGNLFSCEMRKKTELLYFVRKINAVLVKRKIRLIFLKYDGKRALMYMYRPDFLKQDLSRKTAREILSEMCYSKKSPERNIVELINRIKCSEEFPHEIGLFLGYPPEDVQGFIENKAQSAKCTGVWKVYGDTDAAQKKFAQYRKCTDCYIHAFHEHHSIEKLAVAF